MNILTVEDSKIQEVYLQRLLIEQGHTVQGATSGQAALDKLAEQIPDVVITDIVMPGMSGFELCARIKKEERYRHLPVILLTVLSDPQDIVQALQSGADSFITKPYDEEFLVNQLESVVRNRELKKHGTSDFGIQVYFAGRNYHIGSDPRQMLDLLFATYENALQKNKELQQVNEELRAARTQLEQQNEHLAALNDQKNQFLGMAAHDLRNPLGIIQGFSTLLIEADGLPPESQTQLMNRIHASSQFMLQLVDDLLDISAIESGKLELHPEPVAVAKIFQSCVDLNTIPASQKQIGVDVDLPEDLPLISADPSKMDQVINNLLSNAIKFSHSGSRVTLAARAAGDRVQMSVSDSGQGIPADELGKLFQPFQKSSVRATAGEKSTGLGLTIVRRIVEGHGGTIEVESEVGAGTTFTVSVPVAK
ncbi:MAG: hybrid sensor histidine kinase/response regulator [bacterium]|nr:hybrid sensor histidine kinase/response regulator [bacterium]